MPDAARRPAFFLLRHQARLASSIARGSTRVRRKRRPKAASKPNASLGKARRRITAPRERQTSKKLPSSPESARPAAGKDRRAEGWRQFLSAFGHGGGELASLPKLPVERPSPLPHIHDPHLGIARQAREALRCSCSGQASEWP